MLIVIFGARKKYIPPSTKYEEGYLRLVFFRGFIIVKSMLSLGGFSPFPIEFGDRFETWLSWTVDALCVLKRQALSSPWEKRMGKTIETERAVAVPRAGSKTNLISCSQPKKKVGNETRSPSPNLTRDESIRTKADPRRMLSTLGAYSVKSILIVFYFISTSLFCWPGQVNPTSVGNHRCRWDFRKDEEKNVFDRGIWIRN